MFWFYKLRTSLHELCCSQFFFVEMFTNTENLQRNVINDGKNATVRLLEEGKEKIDLS